MRVMCNHVRIKYEGYEMLENPEDPQAHPPELKELYDIMRPHQPEKRTARKTMPATFFFRNLLADQEQQNTEAIEDSDHEEPVVVYEHFHHNKFEALRIMSDSSVQVASHYEPKGLFAEAVWSDGQRLELIVPAKYINKDRQLDKPEIDAYEGEKKGKKTEKPTKKGGKVIKGRGRGRGRGKAKDNAKAKAKAKAVEKPEISDAEEEKEEDDEESDLEWEEVEVEDEVKPLKAKPAAANEEENHEGEEEGEGKKEAAEIDEGPPKVKAKGKGKVKGKKKKKVAAKVKGEAKAKGKSCD